ncbi:E3 ubiquitin-protein ligase Ubr2p [Monosporozyma servazzii]
MSNTRRKTPESLKDFLSFLPVLCNNEYNEVSDYFIWKALSLCLEENNDNIDWRSIIQNFESIYLNKDECNSLLVDTTWRKTFLNDNTTNIHKNAMCGRLCYPIETVYYCFTCITNPLYEICEFCFDPNKHVGHDYISKIVTRDEGRVCHCGNKSVFKDPLNAYMCKNQLNHIPNETKPANKEQTQIIQSTINTVVDYIITTLIENREFHEISFVSSQQKKELNTLGIRESSPYELSAVDSSNSLQLTNLSQFANNKNLKEKWVLQINEDNLAIHPRELSTSIIEILNKPAEYAAVIVQELEAGNSPVTILESEDVAQLEDIHIEFEKRNIHTSLIRMCLAYKHHLSETLLSWLYTMTKNQKDSQPFLYSLRLSLLDRWTARGPQSVLDGHSPHKINLFGKCSLEKEPIRRIWYKPWNFTGIHDDTIKVIMEDYDISLVEGITETPVFLYEIPGSRFQHLLTETLNRLSLLHFHELLNILSSVFSITDDARACLVAQYYDIYLNLLYQSIDITVDRQMAAMSLLSQYTFQDPEYANLAIRNGFVERTLKFAFILMNIPNTSVRCENRTVSMDRDFDLPKASIQNKRTIISLKELCILLSTNTIPVELLSDDSLWNSIFSAFCQFNGILPVKREVGEHVEYENFEFSSFYFFFSSILIMTDSYVRSISLVLDEDFRLKIINKLIDTALRFQFKCLNDSGHVTIKPLTEEEASKQVQPWVFFDVITVKEKVCNHISDVINFQVGMHMQSLLNPMAYLFKFTVQWALSGRYEPLPENLKQSINVRDLTSPKLTTCFILETSLSTLVMLGQIEVGFWVRNGVPISHQAKMYTKYSMREFTYVSDIFNVQLSMQNSDPSDFLVTYYIRWGLKNWCNGTPIGDYPDEQTTVGIVNEALILLIRLLTETKNLIISSSVDSFERTLRTEIVHAICFKHVTYQQIVNDIPEHITKHAAFDSYLIRYTNFHKPQDSDETGTFTLKKEYECEIDPYYYGLSANRRYEVEKEIRQRMEKSNHVGYDDTFIPPKKIFDKLQATPYPDLFAITSVDCFGLFLKNTLDYIKKMKYDVLLPRVVHLIHIAVVNNIHDFTKIFWREYEIVDTEFYHYHSIGSILYSLLAINDFSIVHGEIKQIFSYLKANAPHVDINSYLLEQTESYNPDVLWSTSTYQHLKDTEMNKKKEKARVRKEKILKMLVHQQKRFMENNHTPPSEDDLSFDSTLSSQRSRQSEVPEYMGWKFPDDFCIFCKMNKEDASFVYFSYEEVGICDHVMNFGNIKENILGPIEEKPVVRICGHGSHISCLGKHLKSIRAVQSQTTKNVPNSIGYGLLYCPVCNSLSNSFIPKVREYVPRRVAEFSHKDLDMQDSLRDVSLSPRINGEEAAFILRELVDPTGVLKLDLFQVVSKLLVNTASSLELRLRYDISEFRPSDYKYIIPGQCLQTLRLLSELKTRIYHSSSTKIMDLEAAIYSNNESWYQSILKHCSDDLLSYVNVLFERIGNLEDTANDCFLKILKMKFFQDVLSLSCNLTKTECNINDDSFIAYLERDEFVDIASQMESSSMVLLLNLVKRTLSDVCQNPALLDCSFDRIAPYIYGWLHQSMLVFLRRSYLLFLSRYPDEYEHITTHKKFKVNNIDELTFYLKRFKVKKINHFNLLLQNFIDEIAQQNDIRDILSGYYSESKISLKLGQLTFASSQPLKLIKLPRNLSEICLKLQKIDPMKIIRGEPAMCLFCGKVVNLQQQSALHKFSIGECTNHSRNECPYTSTYGIFLLTRSNTLYLSYANRGTFHETPYRNIFGEVDKELKFGSPVFLDERQYTKFVKDTLLGNLIPHIIYRKTDGNLDLGGWETL